MNDLATWQHFRHDSMDEESHGIVPGPSPADAGHMACCLIGNSLDYSFHIPHDDGSNCGMMVSWFVSISWKTFAPNLVGCQTYNIICALVEMRYGAQAAVYANAHVLNSDIEFV
jgi:hypothetical protein